MALQHQEPEVMAIQEPEVMAAAPAEGNGLEDEGFEGNGLEKNEETAVNEAMQQALAPHRGEAHGDRVLGPRSGEAVGHGD